MNSAICSIQLEALEEILSAYRQRNNRNSASIEDRQEEFAVPGGQKRKLECFEDALAPSNRISKQHYYESWDLYELQSRRDSPHDS